MLNNNLIQDLMRECIKQALLAYKFTLPNPRVGAIVFDDDGNILGKSYHKKYGENHAEVNAILDAKQNGHDLKNKNIIVTLEPCNHYGKTPPCTKAILEAGIKSVYIGVIDDCCNVTGCGRTFLEQNGVQVFTGILEDECKKINLGFNKYNQKQLPYINVKGAMSLNGRIGYPNTWFTSPEAKAEVHNMRAYSDIIITGIGTIISDNPKFTTRLNNGLFFNNTLAILDTELKMLPQYLSKELNVFKEGNRVIIVNACQDKNKQMQLQDAGIESICVDKNVKQQVNIESLILDLTKKGFREIMVESGAFVTTAFLTDIPSYVDKLSLFIEPTWFDAGALNFYRGREANFPKLELQDFKKLGSTILQEYKIL